MIPDGRPTGPVIPADEPILTQYRPTLAELDDARAKLARYERDGGDAYAAGYLASAVRGIAAGEPLYREYVAVALAVLEGTR